MSRKLSISLLVATVMVLVLAGFAWAQTPDATEVPAATATATVGCPSGNFVDNDGDGVCDNREDAATGQQWGPNAGGRMGGMMGGMGAMMGGGMMQSGQNFVDADEDGICDHMEDGTGMQRNNATRHGMGRMGRMGRNMGGNGMNDDTGRGWNR